jgi:transposase
MTQFAMAGRSTKAFAADATLVVVVEMSRSVWLVAGLLPGLSDAH